MVVAWELKNEKGELITTFFNERKATKAKETMEAKGLIVRLDKIFDHHLKDRKPVVKSAKKKVRERTPKDIIPDGCNPVMVFLRPGDLITSELGMGARHKGVVVDGITRLIVNMGGKIMPVITKEMPKKEPKKEVDASGGEDSDDHK